MSTKIHNGYYLNLCSLQFLHRFSMKLRKKILEKQKELYARKLVDLATDIFDTRTLEKAGYYEPDKDNEKNKILSAYCTAYSTAYWEITERYQKTQGSMTRDVDYDLTCNVTLIPTRTKILALIYAEQLEFHEVFESLKEVHPYPYWDSTSDVPKGMTEKGFKARGKEWDKAIPTGIPAMHGFDIRCTKQFLPRIEMDELPSIQDIEARVKEHAHEISARRFFKRTWKENTVPVTEMVPRYSDWRNHLESEEGKKELETIKAELRSVLKNPLTMEDLTAEPEVQNARTS